MDSFMCTLSGEGVGGKFHGPSIKYILREETLKDIEATYLIKNMLGLWLITWDLLEISMQCAQQRNLVTTNLDHYSTYFEITGKTMRHTNGEFPEGAHSTLRKHEERHGFKVKKGLGSQGHVKKSARSLSQLNSRKIGSTPPIRLRASPFSSPLSSFSPFQTTATYSFSPSSFSSPPPSTLTSFSPSTPSQLSSFSSPTPSSQIVYPFNQFWIIKFY